MTKVVILMEQTKTDKLSKIISKIIIIIIIILFVIISISGIILSLYTLPVDENNTEQIVFNLENGWAINRVADELEDENIIRSALVFKIFAKISDTSSFLAGEYNLSQSMSMIEIMENLSTGEGIIDNSISVTFVEGKRFTYYAQKIADTFGYTYDEVIEVTSNEEYLNSLISNYWFITSDILNEKIYYPLEGYLFPDTYTLKEDASIEEVIAKMLDAMDSKLSTYKEEIDISGYSIHSLLTMASVVELEAVTPDDRSVVAGVFYNRLKAQDSLGSDVTTYYGVQKDITESLYQSDINTCNAYNTRGTCNVGSLPVGPIACSSLSSIVAAITPTSTYYYYFVADVNNKLYFAETEAGHQKNISDLKNAGLWPE